MMNYAICTLYSLCSEFHASKGVNHRDNGIVYSLKTDHIYIVTHASCFMPHCETLRTNRYKATLSRNPPSSVQYPNVSFPHLPALSLHTPPPSPTRPHAPSPFKTSAPFILFRNTQGYGLVWSCRNRPHPGCVLACPRYPQRTWYPPRLHGRVSARSSGRTTKEPRYRR